jgi:pinin/SDK/memA/ protein conserved region
MLWCLQELTNVKHRVHLSHFIKTRTEPQLLYRPAKLSEEQTEQIDSQTDKAKADLENVLRRHEEENAAQPKLIEDTDMNEATDNGETKHEDEQPKEVESMDTTETMQPEVAVEGTDNDPATVDQDHAVDEAEHRADTSSQNGDVVDYEGEP